MLSEVRWKMFVYFARTKGKMVAMEPIVLPAGCLPGKIIKSTFYINTTCKRENCAYLALFVDVTCEIWR